MASVEPGGTATPGVSSLKRTVVPARQTLLSRSCQRGLALFRLLLEVQILLGSEESFRVRSHINKSTGENACPTLKNST